MVPADQRLERREAVLGEVEQGLEVELELAVGDRAVQVHLGRPAGLRVGVEVGGEAPVPSAPGGLRRVQREVGVLDQVVGRERVGGGLRNADAGPGAHVMAGDRGGLLEPLDQRRGEALGFDAVAVDQHAKLVAAGARQEAPFGALGEPLRDQLEQLVADAMAERVVDDLEVVEIEAQDGQRAAR